MRTTLNIDDALLADLKESLGTQETSLIVKRALVELRQRVAAERLIALGGSDPDARAAPRRRPPRFVNDEE
jgi:Arc/MetJ family transcription regulator